MATPTATTLLPMWRSPTSTHSLYAQDSWEDDEMDYSSCSATTASPSRIVQCLNFLSQVEEIRIHESHKRLRDTSFLLDVYLTEVDGDVSGKPTYQLERSLSEFEELLAQVSACVQKPSHRNSYEASDALTKQPRVCASCEAVQNKCAQWEAQLPRHFFSRLFGSRPKCVAVLENMLSELIDTSRRQPHVDTTRNTSCSHHDLPAALTSFLVPQELSMDEV